MLCDVGTEFVNVVQVNFRPHGIKKAQLLLLLLLLYTVYWFSVATLELRLCVTSKSGFHWVTSGG
jgi:hypothetical protein